VRTTPKPTHWNTTTRRGLRAVITGSFLRLALVTLSGVVGLSVGAEIAMADCLGPTFTHTGGDLAHGDLLTVTGYGFGDNCYDTGPPPPGEGSLGRPIRDIEVYLAQSGQRHLVAVGNADQDYTWEVQVAIPATLDLGEVDVVVMGNGFEAFRENNSAIWVTSEREEGTAIQVATFGPAGLDEPNPVPEPAFQGTNWTPLLTLGGALITIAGLFALLQRRSTR
jgi:hypothetical protein